MKLIFGLLLRLPGWFFVVLAGLVYVASLQVAPILNDMIQELETQAALEPPAIVDYAGDTALSEGEVALRTTIDFDKSYYFYYETDGPEDFVEYFYFLGDAEETGQFNAVVIFEYYEESVAKAWLESITLSQTDSTNLAELRGFASRSDILDLEAKEGMAYYNAQPSADFVYIRPFVDGRDAYFQGELAMLGMYKEMLPFATWGAIALCLFIGLLKTIAGRIFTGREPAKGPNKLAVAGTTYGAANALLGDDDEDDGVLGELGAGLSVLKLASGVMKKKQPAQAAPTLTVAQDAVDPAYEATKKFKLPSADEMEIYTPPQEAFLPEDEYDALVEAADRHAKALAERNRLAHEQMYGTAQAS